MINDLNSGTQIQNNGQVCIQIPPGKINKFSSQFGNSFIYLRMRLFGKYPIPEFFNLIGAYLGIF